jgi:hypothetical protein
MLPKKEAIPASTLAFTLANAFAMPFMVLPKDNALLVMRASTFLSFSMSKAVSPP